MGCDPLVSVVIPVFNRPEAVVRAVRSVEAQASVDLELIIVDDGSSGSMAAVLEAFEHAGHRVLRRPRGGASAARNAGAAAARGRWLCFLDSDDEWLRDKVALQLRLHESDPVLLISQTREIWIRNGVRVNPRAVHRQPDGEAFFDSVKRCCITPSSVMISSELFRRSGGFDERMRVCEDYDLWLRLTASHRVGLVDRPLIRKFGGHDDQLSRSEPAIDRFRVYALLKLLSNAALSKEQEGAVLDELRRKSLVLETGAVKRGLPHAALLSELASASARLLEESARAALLQYLEPVGRLIDRRSPEEAARIASWSFSNAAADSGAANPIP